MQLDNPSADKIINDMMSSRVKSLEGQIQLKNEALQIFKKLLDANPTDDIIKQQHEMIMVDLKTLTDELLSIRKDSDLISPENVPSLAEYVEYLKEKYICQCCNEVK